MANKSRLNSRDSREKLELAQSIAQNSKRVARTYASFENTLAYVIRWISSIFSRIMFSKKYSKLTALFLAIILYVSVNSAPGSTNSITQASQLSNIPIQGIYNSEIYEVSGIPSEADVIVMGDISDITLQKTQTGSKLVCDLSGLTEGVHQIKLVPSNFVSRLTVNVVDTPTVNVTIKKKVTAKFNITPEIVNGSKMDSIYTVGETAFETTEVLIRASQDTVDSISFVKALIDVTGVTDSFTSEAKIIAYDNNGTIVDCDVIPSTVKVDVEVSTPSKTVPIIVRPIGILAPGIGIDTIQLDYSEVTIYATESVLELIDAIYLDADVTGLASNKAISTPLSKPSGVNRMSVTKINIEIGVAETTTKIIENVPVSWKNYNSDLRFAVKDPNDVYMNVVVTGTASNLEKITIDDVSVAIDMANVTETGDQQAPLVVSGTSGYVTYTIENDRTVVDIQVRE